MALVSLIHFLKMKAVVVNFFCIFVLVTGVPTTELPQVQNVESVQQPIPVYSVNRIVNGSDAFIEEYPYQLSLRYLGTHFCGATLISPTWAITAAHCVNGIFPGFLSVRAGSSFHDKDGETVKVKKKIVHPKYNNVLIDYDVALLQLDKPITNAVARPAVLPEARTALVEGTWATVTGWGATGENRDITQQLQYLNIPLVSQEKCRKYYGKLAITDRMFCAGFEEGGSDSCQGDSGGPLVHNDVLIGIVSWGIGCARVGYPGVYTNVVSVRDFIKNNSGI